MSKDDEIPAELTEAEFLRLTPNERAFRGYVPEELLRTVASLRAEAAAERARADALSSKLAAAQEEAETIESMYRVEQASLNRSRAEVAALKASADGDMHWRDEAMKDAEALRAEVARLTREVGEARADRDAWVQSFKEASDLRSFHTARAERAEEREAVMRSALAHFEDVVSSCECVSCDAMLTEQPEVAEACGRAVSTLKATDAGRGLHDAARQAVEALRRVLRDHVDGRGERASTMPGGRMPMFRDTATAVGDALVALEKAMGGR